MNWSRAKTILIVIFIITDFFLAITIYSSNKKATDVPEEIINSTVDLLKTNEILINKDIIPKKNLTFSVVQADNVISDYDELAKLILGSNAYQHQENVYKSDMGTVKFLGDSFEVSFVKNIAESKSITPSDAKKIAKSFLENLDFNLSDSYIDCSLSKDTYLVHFKGFYGKFAVFSSEVSVEIKNGSVISAIGSWFNIQESLSHQEYETKNATGILIDFMSIYDGVLPCSIVSLELGYNVFDSENYHKSVSLIPTQKITVSNNKSYFIDCRNTN